MSKTGPNTAPDPHQAGNFTFVDPSYQHGGNDPKGAVSNIVQKTVQKPDNYGDNVKVGVNEEQR